jgi:serine O-acetyltransferase
MIKNKAELMYYMKCDKIALKIPEKRSRPRPLIDVIWKYEILLRKTEYYQNKNMKLAKNYYKSRLNRLSNKIGVFIPCNVFGPGLSIAHATAIVVNQNAKVGANCRIHEGVTIGANGGEAAAPRIGDNCFIGSGAKIIGSIVLGNNIAVGAGAVVVKDVKEDGVSVGGVPAKVLSHNGSNGNLVKATELIGTYLID